MLKKAIPAYIIASMLCVTLSSCTGSDSKSTLNLSSPSNTNSASSSHIISSIEEADLIYDPEKSTEENVNYILSKMTLEQKVGQMMQVERQYISAGDITTYNIGSVLAAGGSAPGDNTPQDWRRMTDQYKAAALKTKLKIPLTFAVDAVHGNNNLKDSVIYPHNIGMGAGGDTELIGKVAAQTAGELRSIGVDWTFSPCVAVCRDIRWGRTYEAFSENSDLVSIMAIPYITSLQKIGVIACAKHFIADGAVEYGTGESGYLLDQGNAFVTDRELDTQYLTVYKEAIAAGVKTIMLSYSSVNKIKNHANKELIQNVLKNKLGFKGIVITDWEGIHQLPGENMYQKAITAVNAGVDMLMEGEQWKECYDSIINAAGSNEISQKRINDAVARILRVKIEIGLFSNNNEHTLTNGSLRNYDNVALAEECVRKSLVLLKNDKKSLPLKKKSNIAVIGPAADNIGIQCGGWTKTWQGGMDDSNSRWTSGSTILDGFKEIASKNGGQIITDISNLNKADAVVVAIGEYPYAEGKGDIQNPSLFGGLCLDENELVLKKAYESKKPVIVILVSGRPRVVTDQIDKWSAFVEAWLPGSEGKAVAEVLYGDYQFTGKLPVTWPKSSVHLPVTMLNPSTEDVLFPCGYGLTETINN